MQKYHVMTINQHFWIIALNQQSIQKRRENMGTGGHTTPSPPLRNTAFFKGGAGGHHVGK